MVPSIAPEKIVSGSSQARKNLSGLLDEASKGTPVTIVSGDRVVTMIGRDLYLSIMRRLRLAEEMTEILSDPDALAALNRFKTAMERGELEGITPDEAARLLGVEK